ncbi:MAG: N-acetylneuraminate synthase [Clostridiales Family XIII bacterium]|jgi:N-acetylneuraminate synthase|nr:N-acetylneuraminate synthase [Clostridiales Family XIII bacterium]
MKPTETTPTYIIAEAGVNHNGDVALAHRLVSAAKQAGADAVKFQTFRAEALVSADAEKADYQKEATGAQESQLDMIRALELRYEDFRDLARHCAEEGIQFLSTAFDAESLDFLMRDIGQPLVKIPSGEITNLPLLLRAASYRRPVILSTGMSSLAEVLAAYDALRGNGAPEVTLLHCTTEYPAPLRDVNLRAMDTLQKVFNCAVGYSDHTEGIEVPVAAAARGASVIEKHFTLDRSLPGPDHRASLDPSQLAEMVRLIRNIERALGDAEKRATPSESGNVAAARKSIVAARAIGQGELFSEENLTTKRPGTGISPMRWLEVIGRAAPRSFAKDERIEL